MLKWGYDGLERICAALHQTPGAEASEAITVAKDPVCGMDVDERNAPAKSEYKGQTYYFCARGCKVAFDKEPERYLQSQSGHQGHQH